MAVRLFPWEHVERELWRRDCRMIKEYETATLWATQKGYHFIVPKEGPDRRCDEYTFTEILADVDRALQVWNPRIER
jgi:hypothetical protein